MENLHYQELFRVDPLDVVRENVNVVPSTSTSSRTMQQPVPKPKRGQANKRERVRTENVNAGFDNLRRLIPTDPEDRKLSKIEILRLATSYINHLYNLTRANSCLEAQSIDYADSLEDLDSDDDYIARDSDMFNCRKFDRSFAAVNINSKKHVCTFCLMMTKTSSAAQTTSTTNSNNNNKRK